MELLHLNPLIEGHGAQPADENLDGIDGNGVVSRKWKGAQMKAVHYNIAPPVKWGRYFYFLR